MGPWESALEFMQAVGLFSLLAALLIFTLVFYGLVIWLRKAAKREPKTYEKALFAIVAILAAALIFIFSVGEAAAIVTTYVMAAIFLAVMFFLIMILALSFFGKPTWKFWKIGSHLSVNIL